MKQLLILITFISFTLIGCNIDTSQQKSDSGVVKASVKIKTDVNGNTIEQKNIMERLKRDNDIGAVKHLYIISSYSGDVMEYSTVKGKVTSGSKRLSPKTVIGNSIQTSSISSNDVKIGNLTFATDEVLDDGGAYGESGNYLYWFDAQDNYHQYYPSGGTYLHISEKPLRIRKSNMTLTVD